MIFEVWTFIQMDEAKNIEFSALNCKKLSRFSKYRLRCFNFIYSAALTFLKLQQTLAEKQLKSCRKNFDFRRRSASNDDQQIKDELPIKKPFRKQATLTLITVEEDENRILTQRVLKESSPPPYEEVVVAARDSKERSIKKSVKIQNSHFLPTSLKTRKNEHWLI